jgi:hypothetical protein
MTAAQSGAGDANWSVGSAISTASAILFGHFVAFVGTALAASVPSLIIDISMPGSFTRAIVDLVVGQIVTVTLVYGALQALRGRTVSIGECFSQGMRRLGSALGVALLSGIGIALGMVLLVVPGLILATMWAVAVPVAVIEERSSTAALNRSQELTSGRRWRVFFAYLVSLLIMIVGGAVIEGIIELVAGEGSTESTVGIWVFSALVQAFTATLVATLYYFLRREKEGVDIDQIAAVFD